MIFESFNGMFETMWVEWDVFNIDLFKNKWFYKIEKR